MFPLIGTPIYNGLVYLVSIMPGESVGLAIIALTIIIKIALFPISQKSLELTAKNNELQPLVDKIQNDPNLKKEERATKIFELYKEHKHNPFSGCIVAIIQAIVLIALYMVLQNGFIVDPSHIYSAINIPQNPNMMFLGINLGIPSIVLAIIAGVIQFVQVYFSPSFKQNKSVSKEINPSAPASKVIMQSFQKNMTKSFIYMMPIIIIFAGISLPASVTLYWVVNTIITIFQELLIRRKAKRPEAVVVS